MSLHHYLDSQRWMDRRRRDWWPWVFSLATALIWQVLIASHLQGEDRPKASSEKGVAQRLRLPAEGSERSWAQRLAISPDGRMVAIRDSDWRVSIWDVATGRILHQLANSDDRMDALLFNMDGRLLVTSAPVTSDTIAIWDVSTGSLQHQLRQRGEILMNVDRSTIQMYGDHQVVRIHLPTGRIIETVHLRGVHHANPLRFAPAGDKLLLSLTETSGMDYQLEWYDLKSHERQAIDSVAGEPVMAAVSPSSQWIASVNRREPLIRATVDSMPGSTLYLAGHRDRIQSLQLTPDAMFLVSGGDDGFLQVWDVITRQAAATISFPGAQITDIEISDDGRWLAVTVKGMEHDVLVWNFVDLLGQQDAPSARAFSNVGEAFSSLAGDHGHAGLVYLLSHQGDALPLVEEHVRRRYEPLPPESIQQYIQNLDHAEFRQRDAAFRALQAHRFQIRDQLQAAADTQHSLETRLSLHRLLRQEAASPPEEPEIRQLLRMVYFLEHYEGNQARALLALLRSSHADLTIRRAAEQAEQRLDLALPVSPQTPN